MYNCGHEAHKYLTVDDVSTKTGRWLHNFMWIEDYARENGLHFDDLVGELPEEWNWLDGHSLTDIEAKNVHFTRGGPRFEEWQDVEYAKEWFEERDKYLNQKFKF